MTEPKLVAVNKPLMVRLNKLEKQGKITRIQSDKAVVAWRNLAKHADRHDLYNNWVNVHSRQWWNVLGKKLARPTLDLLQDQDVILRTNSYSRGHFPKACKVIGPYRSRRRCEFYELRHRPTIEANRHRRNVQIDADDAVGNLLAVWLSSFVIDRSILTGLDAWTIENVSAINEQNHFAVRDRFAGRFHSPFSQLQRDAREAIKTVDGRHTYSLDVSACQPLLLGLIAQMSGRIVQMDARKVGHIEGKDCWWVPPDGVSHSLSLSHWMYLCEQGTLYREIQYLLRKKPNLEDRVMMSNWGHNVDLTQLKPKMFKRQVLQLIFDRHTSSIRHPIWRVLTTHFPEIANTLTLLKEKTHERAAKALQEFEAVIMLDQVAKRHASHDVPVLTVHDEIISPEPELTERIIYEVFSRYHVTPNIKVKCHAS